MDQDLSGVEPPDCLLLLPTPPSDTTDTNINAAYGPAIRTVINSTQASGGKRPARLDIAVQCNSEPASDSATRSYGYFEKIIARLYSLAVYISSEKGNSLSIEDIPDIAIFFIEALSSDNEQLSVQDQRERQGPLVPLKTLAFCQRPWNSIYSLDGEAGERLLREFVEQRQSLGSADRCSSFETHRVPGGMSLQVASMGSQRSHSDKPKQHRSVAVGGTFDHIHAGHKLLLTATALALERKEHSGTGKRMLTIGITGDELLKKKKYAEYLESWEHRQQSVYSFLNRILNFSNKRPDEQSFNEPGPNGKGVRYTFDDGLVISCVELSDPFGPTITDEAISALVVSAETRSGGQAVNDKRKEKNWSLLEVFEVDVLDSKPPSSGVTAAEADFESKISSTEIRRQLQERAA